MRQALTRVLLAVVAVLLLVPVARAQGLTEARELYASAAYEQALALLDRLKQQNAGSPDTALAIEQYRAFCLLALDRKSEAEQAIEAIYAINPLYRPQEDDASPWVRTVFQEVHRRVLPTVLQQQYIEAKAAYDRKDYAESASRFKRVLALLDDPDLPPDKIAVADLKTLAEGFLSLSVDAARAAAAPPSAPPPTPPPTPPPAPVVPAPSATEAAAKPGPRIYGADDTDVTPPVPILQEIPRWPFAGGPDNTLEGIIEIVVSETGAVESTAIRRSVNGFYDSLLLQRAKGWRYQPATRNGERVKYRRMIKFVVPPR
jgi:hypothetical protein